MREMQASFEFMFEDLSRSSTIFIDWFGLLLVSVYQSVREASSGKDLCRNDSTVQC